MRRKFLSMALLLLATFAFAAHAGVKDWLEEQIRKASPQKVVDPTTVSAGLREALEHGTSRAVRELGREDGFWKHPRLRIPMPEKLHTVERGLRRLGQDKLADDFALSLNRAAEQATPAAQKIFVDAIRGMTIRDAMDILRGPPDAATRYFRQHTEGTLAEAFRPIVARSTDAVGATANYKKIIKKVEPLGLANAASLDIDEYVTQKALAGLFGLVAEEERRIREDPAARTTELLRKVFSTPHD
ncbi:MAG: DUF4197 domain-containing protein [Sulfurifustaceae bacterium]